MPEEAQQPLGKLSFAKPLRFHFTPSYERRQPTSGRRGTRQHRWEG